MLYLSAGHHPRAPGAAWQGFVEHTEAMLWVQEIARALPSAIVVPTGELGAKVRWINARAGAFDLALEIHFNAAPGNRGQGSEVLYMPGSSTGLKVARTVQATVAQHFAPDRGIKPGFYQAEPTKGPLYFLKATRCTALILEPEFIYHADIIRARRSSCCAALANLLRGIAHDGRITDLAA
jgi:N-acetylmuramoyl-L-alanine amidase